MHTLTHTCGARAGAAVWWIGCQLLPCRFYGLFSCAEPELHLIPRLLRTWKRPEVWQGPRPQSPDHIPLSPGSLSCIRAAERNPISDLWRKGKCYPFSQKCPLRWNFACNSDTNCEKWSGYYYSPPPLLPSSSSSSSLSLSCSVITPGLSEQQSHHHPRRDLLHCVLHCAPGNKYVALIALQVCQPHRGCAPINPLICQRAGWSNRSSNWWWCGRLYVRWCSFLLFFSFF